MKDDTSLGLYERTLQKSRTYLLWWLWRPLILVIVAVDRLAMGVTWAWNWFWSLVHNDKKA